MTASTEELELVFPEPVDEPVAPKKKAGVVKMSNPPDKNTLVAFFNGDPKSNWLKNRDRISRLQQHWGFQKEIQHLPVEALEPYPWHPRKVAYKEDTKELAHSLRFHGLGRPLIVMQQPDNPEKYWVLDGLRRLKALSYQGVRWKTIACQVSMGMSKHQALALMVAMDDNVKHYNIIQRGAAYYELRTELGLVQESLASYLRVSQTEIWRCETARDAFQPELLEDILADSGCRVSDTHLVELVRLRLFPEEQRRLFDQVQTNGYSSRWLRREINQLLAAVPPRLRRRNLKIENHLFAVTIKTKTNRPIAAENLKAELLLVNKAFFEAWNLTIEELADWYDRVANILREEYRARRRQHA